VGVPIGQGSEEEEGWTTDGEEPETKVSYMMKKLMVKQSR